ncbi:MAG: tyrosine-protein phosphatase [Sphingomonadaceae bacterium]
MNSVAPAEFARALPLEGAFNLRDLGGYATGCGGRVKHGMLYRSGRMSRLTPEDERHLADLGIVTVCDLRRPGERAAEPTRWCEPAGVHYWSRDYTETSGVLGEVLHNAEATPDAMRAAMITVYREIPVDHAPSYRFMFDRLLSGHAPLLFNCAAGKDRTGVAAALILHALGVPRDTIYEDYLLTNSHADFSDFLNGRQSAIVRVALRAPEVIAPLFAADTTYLDAMFETLDEDHGGIDGYLQDMLSVDAAARARLRELLVD